ncbi:MAG: pyrimidine dimer DNA glycosylase/endonuclease V [Anditalea sp.]
MRIWSIHPKYLDTKGLLALWRETLLAKKVLEGKTTGYRNHPQLDRFKESNSPLDAINQYLSIVYEEAVSRQFNFDLNKFSKISMPIPLSVNQGQLKYEFGHLLGKLKNRDLRLYHQYKEAKTIDPHPIFRVVNGEIEKWEIV